MKAQHELHPHHSSMVYHRRNNLYLIQYTIYTLYTKLIHTCNSPLDRAVFREAVACPDLKRKFFIVLHSSYRCSGRYLT
jgi:hypothetical protein